MRNKIVENVKGVTLVALVVTIIILLILAGITIAITTGDNGLINRAKNAKVKTEIASIKEEIQTEILGKQAENNGNISDDTLKEILEKYGVLSEEGEKLIDKTLTTTKGNHGIKVSDIFNGTTIEDENKEEPTFTTVANEPDISGFNKSNTYYVSWDLTTSPYNVNDTTSINGVAPNNWYDYTQGVNHWANVKTTGGGNDCYWVWIPRYAYCITEGYHNNTAKTIDIKFLQGTTNTPIDGSNIEIKNQTGSGNWNTHPAFWFDKNNNGVEDDGEQLTGIWVAKFEASSSSSSVVENPTATDLEIDGGSDTDTDLKVRVKPNVTSWRKIDVNSIFTVCRNLTEQGNSLENTKDLNSHLIKNTEWGACAYLSRSVYGKNSEVWNNPYYNDKKSYSPITGLCSNETDGKDKEVTDITKTCKYNEVGGENASTTGNVYGIYDMSGGAWEYVAGYLSEITANENYTTLESAAQKYKDIYSGTSIDRDTNYNANAGKYGDAIYETSGYGNAIAGSWDRSLSGFLDSKFPVFKRGGHAYSGTNAGIFAFQNDTGEAVGYDSFRPVVLSLEPY